MRVIGMGVPCTRHGVPLCSCWPLASPSSRAALSLWFSCFFPFFAALVALSAAQARPVCALCSLLCFPCLAAPCPHPLSCHFSPPHPLSAVTLIVQSVHFRPPSLPLPCILPRVPPAGSTMPFSVVPTLSPSIGSHLHPAHSEVLLSPSCVLCPPSPTVTPSGTPWVHGEGER